MRFLDKVAVVTGAGSGIGLSCAKMLASEGAITFVNDVDETRANVGVEAIKALNKTAIAAPCDVSNQSLVEKAVERIVDQYGRIDVLINNAALATSAPAEDYPAWNKILDVNLSGAYYWARAAARASMIKRASGSIVNVSSITSSAAMPYDIGYVVSKHGLIGLTKALAVEWARFGIRVNCACPAFTNTPIIEEVERIHPGKFDTRRQRVPLGRMARPEEQARAILFLASDEASYCTGTVLYNDGGQTALLSGYDPPRSPI